MDRVYNKLIPEEGFAVAVEANKRLQGRHRPNQTDSVRNAVTTCRRAFSATQA